MADYINSTVTSAVVQGLARVTAVQPRDPVDFLGNYLLNYAATLEQQQRTALAAAQDEKQRAMTAQQAGLQKAQEDTAAAAKHALTTKLNSLIDTLNTCTEVTPAALESALATLCEVTSASSAYVCEGFGVGEGRDETAAEADPAAETGHIQYISSMPSQRWITTLSLKPGAGVLWRLWDVPPALETAADPSDSEAGEEAAAAAPPRPLEPLLIRSVLQTPNMVFHRLPRPGAFLAVPLVYPTLLHKAAVMSEEEEAAVHAEEGERVAAEAAAAKEAREAEEGQQGEEGEEQEESQKEQPIVAAPTAVTGPLSRSAPRYLAICIDTVDSSAAVSGPAQDAKPITDDAVAAVTRVAAALRDALIRTEGEEFKQEHALVAAARAAGKEAAVSKEDAVVVKAASLASAKLAEDAPEDAKQLAGAVAQLEAARKLLLSQKRQDAFAALLSRRIQPGDDALRVIRAALLQQGFPAEALQQANGPEAKATAWEAVKAVLKSGGNPSFWEMLRSWDPSTLSSTAVADEAGLAAAQAQPVSLPGAGAAVGRTAPAPLRPKPATLRAMLEGLLVEDGSPAAQDEDAGDGGAAEEVPPAISALREACTALLPLAHFIVAATEVEEASKAKQEREAAEAAATAAAAAEAAAAAAEEAAAAAEEAAAAAAAAAEGAETQPDADAGEEETEVQE